MAEINTEISGVFLSFSDGEYAAILGAMEAMEYSPDSDGVKKYLLDCINDDMSEDEQEPERDREGTPLGRVATLAAAYLRDNPEALAQMQGAASALRSRMADIIRKRQGK